jgi:glutathione S-transferase
MKIYGGFASPYVARTVMAARAKGIDVPIMFPDGGIKTPDFLKMNPMGKMPTLDDQGFAVAESGVILEYLEDAGGGKPLLPKDARGRANARLIARITDIYLMAQTSGMFRNLNPAQRNQADVDAAITGTKNALRYLEHYVDANGPYLCGKELTIADCTLLPSLLMCVKYIYPRFGWTDAPAATPKLARWFASMQASAEWSGFCKEYCDGFEKFMAAQRG